MERLEAARSMRESAGRLRQIAASNETALSAELLRIAAEIEEDAERLEESFRKNPARPAANDGNAVA